VYKRLKDFVTGSTVWLGKFDRWKENNMECVVILVRRNHPGDKPEVKGGCNSGWVDGLDPPIWLYISGLRFLKKLPLPAHHILSCSFLSEQSLS
jgi:hypothetical protein